MTLINLPGLCRFKFGRPPPDLATVMICFCKCIHCFSAHSPTYATTSELSMKVFSAVKATAVNEFKNDSVTGNED